MYLKGALALKTFDQLPALTRIVATLINRLSELEFDFAGAAAHRADNNLDVVTKLCDQF